jgi:hypothetical protein
MRRSVRGSRALPLIFAVAVAACGSEEDTPTSPTPIVPTVSERFEDTIGTNHARTHTFISGSGVITATLTSVAPIGDTILGVSLGTWNGAACQLVVTNDAIRQGQTVTGQASTPGNFCVRVYDVGQITQPTTYVVEVIHRE